MKNDVLRKKQRAYYVSSHLTGVFSIKDMSEDPLKKGSIGAGLCLKKGVQTVVVLKREKKAHFTRSAKNDPIILEQVKIFFDNRQVPLPSAASTLEALKLFAELESLQPYEIEIYHRFDVPMGAGYSTSAAGAIGVVFALNDLLSLELSRETLFQLAHKADLFSGGGLGSVLGLYEGGMVLRTKAGAPGVGTTKQMVNDFPPDSQLYIISFGSISTKKVLSDPVRRAQIIMKGDELLKTLFKDARLSQFFSVSEEFTRYVGLTTPKIVVLLERLWREEIPAAMNMFGESIFAMATTPQEKNLVERLGFKPISISFNTVQRIDTVF